MFSKRREVVKFLCITNSNISRATAAAAAAEAELCMRVSIAATDTRRNTDYSLVDDIVSLLTLQAVCQFKSSSVFECWRRCSAMWSADFLLFCWHSATVSWLCAAVSVASGIILAPVYWNSSNPM